MDGRAEMDLELDLGRASRICQYVTALNCSNNGIRSSKPPTLGD
jgi:hypothetical protein